MHVKNAAISPPPPSQASSGRTQGPARSIVAMMRGHPQVQAEDWTAVGCPPVSKNTAYQTTTSACLFQTYRIQVSDSSSMSCCTYSLHVTSTPLFLSMDKLQFSLRQSVSNSWMCCSSCGREGGVYLRTGKLTNLDILQELVPLNA